MTQHLLRGISAFAVLIAFASCGGGNSSTPTAPSGGGSSSSTTITITSAGVSPKSITASPGSRVLFVNNDSRPHEMDSDPHPEHTDCPAINQVGFLSPGQSRETGNLNAVRTCGFHDHNMDRNTSLQGTIVIR